MRLAVLSDIHGNLAALEAVLTDLKASGGADLTWCLGDLAAFGPRPSECVTRIRNLAAENDGATFKVIGGNTDRYLVNGTRFPTPSAKDEDTFQKLSAEWQTRDTVLNWNVGRLTWDDYEFLKKICHQELSYHVDGYGWVLGFHAVPGNDEAFLTQDTPVDEALDFMLDREGRLGVCGHTHIQMNRELGRWHLVNVGSVGLPIDHVGKACYGVFMFERDTVHVDLRQVDYDIDVAIAELYDSGHPAPDWVARRIKLATE